LRGLDIALIESADYGIPRCPPSAVAKEFVLTQTVMKNVDETLTSLGSLIAAAVEWQAARSCYWPRKTGGERLERTEFVAVRVLKKSGEVNWFEGEGGVRILRYRSAWGHYTVKECCLTIVERNGHNAKVSTPVVNLSISLNWAPRL